MQKTMELFVYLKKEYIQTWIDGGKIPINPASNYQSEIRNGIYTPDENIMSSLKGTTYDVVNQIVDISGKAKLNLSIGGGIVINGIKKSGPVEYKRSWEDYLIQCFANSFSSDLAKKLGKNACVKITDFNKIKETIDKQLGFCGVAKKCEYVTNEDRNHFKKSVEDSWQDEFRIVWPRKNQLTWVNIPANCCEDMTHLLNLD